MGIVDPCTYTWSQQANTNVDSGRLASTGTTVTACQQACIANVACTGVDWIPAQVANARSCWMSGPWSGTTNVGTAVGSTHYNIVRNCPGQTYRRITITVLLSSRSISLTVDTLDVAVIT